MQSLGLMNNDFVLRMAHAFAKRLEAQAGSDVREQIDLAYRLAYGRDLNGKDFELSRSFIRKHGLVAWCRVIFNSNELLYVR